MDQLWLSFGVSASRDGQVTPEGRRRVLPTSKPETLPSVQSMISIVGGFVYATLSSIASA